jgi:hypothetical protein|tara:strand:- start:72 stop:1724 length:1653 start_codon:yes stop_codon:yes gene_type:complete
MAVDHIKVVTVDPVDDAYSWSIVDSATGSAPTWVAITNQQNNGVDTDTWVFTVQVNSNAARQAIATVNHSGGTTDSFTMDQAGNLGSSSPSSYTSILANTDPINEGQNLIFTISGSNLSDGTVGYTLSGTNITAGDTGAQFPTGTVNIVGNTNSGTLTIPITADALTEGNETIVITLGSSDSNGVSTNALTANAVITDSSTTPDTPVSLTFQNNNNIVGNPNQSEFNVTAITLLSGSVSNSAINMTGVGIASADFDATANSIIELEIELTRRTSPALYQFTQVGSNQVATLAGANAGMLKISEDITGVTWPEKMSMIVEYTVPGSSSGVTINQGINATTMVAPTPADFTFTGGSIGSTPFSITQNGNDYQLTFANNNSQTLTMNYDSNIVPDETNLGVWFTKPSWLSYYGNINPINHNTNTNSGTILFTLAANSSSSTRSGDLVYIGGETLPGTGVNHIDITQPGVQNYNPQGKSERRLKYDIELVGESAMGIPMYHFNYKDEANGKGRFIGTMVDDLERLGFEDVLIHTKDGILVDYNKIDVPFHTITN